MSVYHRLTANGIETMVDPVSYTFECKVCGARCQTADGAYDHYRQHAVDSTFTKTLIGSQDTVHTWLDDGPNSRSCEISGCRIPPQYLHHVCRILLCPQHIVRHHRHCTFTRKESANVRTVA